MRTKAARKKRLLERLPVEDDELTERLKDRVVAHGGNAAAAVGATLSATGSFLFQESSGRMVLLSS